MVKQTTDNIRLKPKLFWEKVDSIFDDVKKWVLVNCGDTDYQCCGKASEVLYRLFIDWGIEKCKDENMSPYIVVGIMRGLEHHWVEIAEFVFDPTAMQFDPEPTIGEYSKGMQFVDYRHNNILDSEEILKICKSIRPDIYRE